MGRQLNSPGINDLLTLVFYTPVHSNSTSPSDTLHTNALSSSPPVTARLLVTGSKLTQKTEPANQKQHSVRADDEVFLTDAEVCVWSHLCVWRSSDHCHLAQTPSHPPSPIHHHLQLQPNLHPPAPPPDPLNTHTHRFNIFMRTFYFYCPSQPPKRFFFTCKLEYLVCLLFWRN